MARKNILQPHVFYRNFMGAYLYFVITIQEKKSWIIPSLNEI